MRSTIRFIVNMIFSLLPATRFFGLKRAMWRIMGVKVGKSVRISSTARIITTGQVIIGDGSWVGHEFLVIGGTSRVNIGADTDIGPRVTVATGTHEILIGEHRAAGPGRSLDVTIGDGTWVGAGVTILGGGAIGRCCIVAAGAVVKGEFPDRVLIGGVPAKVIRALH